MRALRLIALRSRCDLDWLIKSAPGGQADRKDEDWGQDTAEDWGQDTVPSYRSHVGLAMLEAVCVPAMPAVSPIKSLCLCRVVGPSRGGMRMVGRGL